MVRSESNGKGKKTIVSTDSNSLLETVILVLVMLQCFLHLI